MNWISRATEYASQRGQMLSFCFTQDKFNNSGVRITVTCRGKERWCFVPPEGPRSELTVKQMIDQLYIETSKR